MTKSLIESLTNGRYITKKYDDICAITIKDLQKTKSIAFIYKSDELKKMVFAYGLDEIQLQEITTLFNEANDKELYVILPQIFLEQDIRFKDLISNESLKKIQEELGIIKKDKLFVTSNELILNINGDINLQEYATYKNDTQQEVMDIKKSVSMFAKPKDYFCYQYMENNSNKNPSNERFYYKM